MIRADKPEKPRIGHSLAKLANRVNRVGWGRTFQLKVICDKFGLVGDRRFDHFEAAISAQRFVLVRRKRSGHESHLVEVETFQRLTGKDQMPVMNRAEGAAVDSNFAQSD